MWTSLRGSAVDGVHARIVSPELRKSHGSFTRDRGFQPQTDEVCFFLYPHELGRALHELIVSVQRRPHVHQYALVRHHGQG